MTRNLTLLGTVFLLLNVRAAQAEPRTESKTVSSVAAQGYADVEAVVPGKKFHLAVVLEPQQDWHVYWRGAGGTGMPTEILWSGPPGFEFGRTEFPIPESKFDSTLKEDSWILQGKLVFVTPVSVPSSASPGSQVKFEVTASWLACKKQCIPGRVQFALSLPVVASQAGVKPANVELFKDAESSYPVPSAKAEHIKISGSLDQPSVAPGGKFDARLTIEIAAQHHMQSHKPLIEGLIPAYVFLEPTEGLEFGEVKYPEPHVREDKLLGKLSEYEGKVQFTIPVQVDEKADKSARWIRGVLQYQICNNSGTCYPPVDAEFEIPVRMKDGPATSAAYSFLRPNVEGGINHPKQADAFSETPVGSENSPAVEASGPASPSLTNRFFGTLNQFQDWLLTFGYSGALIVAFIGGFILNLMPCVLPVISLKVLSFVRQAHEHRMRIFLLGLTYAAGILVFFGVLAVLFAKFGTQWGELSQYPQVNLILAGVVTAFAMSLFGVFTVFTPRIINKLDEKVEGEGFGSAFATGVLATVLGTACTAPFLSAAIGAASRFTPAQGAGIFMMSGVGMAFPYVFLAANPKWLRFVPKPGPWMGAFEGLMGFLLLGTVIWLLNPLRGQIGDFGVLLCVSFLIMVALAVWIRGKVEWGASVTKKLVLYSLAGLSLVLGWMIPFRWIATIDDLKNQKMRQNVLLALGEEYEQVKKQNTPCSDPALLAIRELDWSKGIPWQRYRRDSALRDVKNGYTVFIDYTADWCINCKAILKGVIDTPEVIALMKQNKVIPYEADYTNPVQEIKEDLARFQRGGVPVQVVYKPHDPDKPDAFQAFDQQTLLNALNNAGPSILAGSQESQVASRNGVVLSNPQTASP